VHHISQQAECALTPSPQAPLTPSIAVPAELF